MDPPPPLRFLPPTTLPLYAAVTVHSGWSAVFDAKSQAFYYHNLDTDETTWVLPAAATAAGPDPVPEPFSKSSPDRDDPVVRADKRSKAGGGSSSDRGGGGGGDAKSKSAKRSRRRNAPGDDGGGGELVEASEAASAKTSSRKDAETSTTAEKGPEEAGKDAPKDAKPAAAAADKEGDPASSTPSLPRYGFPVVSVQGRNFTCWAVWCHDVGDGSQASRHCCRSYLLVITRACIMFDLFDLPLPPRQCRCWLQDA